MQTSELVKYVKKELDALLDTATNLKAQRDKLRKEYEENKTQCALQNQKFKEKYSVLESEKQSLLEQEKMGCDREMKKLLDTQKAKLVNLESQFRTRIISSIEANYPEASKKISGLQKGIYESKVNDLNKLTLLELIDLNEQLVQFRLQSSQQASQPPQSKAQTIQPELNVKYSTKEQRDYYRQYLLNNEFDQKEDKEYLDIIDKACKCNAMTDGFKQIKDKLNVKMTRLKSINGSPVEMARLRRKIGILSILGDTFNKYKCTEVSDC